MTQKKIQRRKRALARFKIAEARAGDKEYVARKNAELASLSKG